METIYSRLRAWRWERARDLNLPSFFVLSNAHLAGVALAQPTTVEELAKCPGMGPKKLAQFGEELAALVARCVAEGLEPGVVPPPQAEEGADAEERPLSEEEVQAIGEALRQEVVRLLVRRLRGRYSRAQVAEALRRLGAGVTWEEAARSCSGARA